MSENATVDTEVKETEVKETEVKETEVKETEVKETEVKETEVTETPAPVAAAPEPVEELSYHAVEKDGKITAIWEMRGKKHVRTIDPRSEEGKHLLGHTDNPEAVQNATV